jgi:hypothetical protein
VSAEHLAEQARKELDALDFHEGSARKDAIILAAIRQAVAEERAACAALAEARCAEWDAEGDGESLAASQQLYGMASAGRSVAAAIRARGEAG